VRLANPRAQPPAGVIRHPSLLSAEDAKKPRHSRRAQAQATCSSATRTLPLVSGLSSNEITTLTAATTVPTSIGIA